MLDSLHRIDLFMKQQIQRTEVHYFNRMILKVVYHHEQLSGSPTSLGETFVERPIHCLIAFIMLRSRCTLV